MNRDEKLNPKKDLGQTQRPVKFWKGKKEENLIVEMIMACFDCAEDGMDAPPSDFQDGITQDRFDEDELVFIKSLFEDDTAFDTEFGKIFWWKLKKLCYAQSFGLLPTRCTKWELWTNFFMTWRIFHFGMRCPELPRNFSSKNRIYQKIDISICFGELDLLLLFHIIYLNFQKIRDSRIFRKYKIILSLQD